MDAAQKLLRTSALLAVFALLMAVPGWAQPKLQAPSSATIGASGFVSVDVSSSAAGTTEITYTVETPDYSGDQTFSGSWLVVTGGTVTPASLTFSLRNGSQAGISVGASATVRLTPSAPSGVAAVTIKVTFAGSGGGSGGGGGGSTTLSASANSVNLSAGVNSTNSTNVTITTSSPSQIAIFSTSSVNVATNWLSSSLSTNTVSLGASSTLTISANSSNLTFGVTYQGTVTVTPSTGTQLNITVNFTVGGSGGNGNWIVSPSAVAWNFTTNSGVYPTQVVSLSTNSGSASYNVATLSSNFWLLVSGGGTEGNNLSLPVGTPFTLKLGSQGNALSAGTYSGQAIISDSSGNEQIRVTVTLTVNGGNSAGLNINPSAVTFNTPLNGAQQSQIVNVSSNVGGILTITGSLPAGLSYTLPASSTIDPGGTVSFSVYANPSGLPANTYTGSLQIQVGAQTGTLNVSMIVGGGGSSGTLSFSPTSLALTSVNGSTPSASLYVTSTFNTAFNATISYFTGSGNWLTVSPLSGVTSQYLLVSANPAGLAVGSYGANIIFNGVQTVGVTLTVSSTSSNTGNVTVTPTTLSFTSQSGSSPAAQTIRVDSASGSAGVAFTVQVTAGSSWLSTNANASNLTSATLTVSVNSSALTAGSYSGNIRIFPSGGSTVDVPVNLTVTTPPAVSASPTTLTFNYRAGDNPPSSQPLAVSGGGAALAFTVTTSSNGNWLVASPTSGTTPATGTATVNVSINPAGLSTGTYNGTILVAGAGTASGSTTVNVTVNVTAPLPTLTSVTHAASGATGPIAPGEIITLKASDPTHPIGPATAAFLTLDSTGKVATTIGGVQVLINGFACPMVFASATQANAVVPYELKLFTSATVLVKFLGQTSNGVPVTVATTVPGVFTANATGTGPGAIANSNGTANSPANPATRGDTVVVYVTGEGETSPAGVTGKVTTVAAPPQPLTPAPLLPVSVTVGGQGAQYTFAGEAPGFVSGVLQVNVIVPTNIAAGDQLIVVSVGGNQSQPGVTVSVK